VNKIIVRIFAAGILCGGLMAGAACWQKTYDPGASDTEIKIGNVSPYSGPFLEYGAVARAEAAYFQMINDRGGVNGRKIVFLSEDGGARKSEELTRKLVEADGVLLMFSSFGTEPNLAVRGYLNEKKIPQLFVQSSSAVFDDPAHFPWTMGFFATYRVEGMVYAKWILQNKPTGKIALLHGDDDAGREYAAGVREGLADKAGEMIVKELSYRDSDADVEAQIAEFKKSGADVLMNMSVGKFATLAIRSAFISEWHPAVQFIPNASLSVAAFIEPAGLPAAAGIISNARSKNWWRLEALRDPGVREFVEWMNKYNSKASQKDQNYASGYERAQVLVEVLRMCGDDLSRANVMKQAANLDMELGLLRSGIRVKTSPTEYQPIHDLFLIRFSGKEWTAFGPLGTH
jgi:branched-chain amino acid transport system substrate-binding protein